MNTAEKANRVAMVMLNAKSRVDNRKAGKDDCDMCENRGSSLCRECNGRSGYKPDK